MKKIIICAVCAAVAIISCGIAVGYLFAKANAEKSKIYGSESSQVLTVDETLPQVAIDPEYECGNDYIKLTWVKADGASGYKIYRSIDDGWLEIGSVDGAESTEFTDINLNAGAKFYYMVRQFKSDGATDVVGKESEPFCAVTPPNSPEINSSIAFSTEIRITWSAVSCSGYRIDQFMEDTAKWETVQLIDSSENSCTLTGLNSNTDYNYRIMAFTNDGSNDHFGESSYSTLKTVNKDGYIFIGDSRTVQMSQAVNAGDGIHFIAESSMGYNWFVNQAIPMLEQMLSENPDEHYDIIIAMGVNDINDLSLYISKYDELAIKYPDQSFHYLSVNPINDSPSINCTTKQINAFNSSLKSNFPEKYIDTYSLLKERGFNSADGLHYDNDTYQFIFDEVIKYLNS